jgi:diacylglycerol kinase family enzyme
VLVNGKVANIDLGKINEDYFANGSSIGMPAIVGLATPHSLKKWFGRGAYGLVAAYEFMRFCAVPLLRHGQWSADRVPGI